MHALFLTVVFALQPNVGTEPPLAPVAPFTLADLEKAVADVKTAVEKEAKVRASVSKTLERVGGNPLAPLMIGKPGPAGPPGLSAYEIAKKNGFVGTEVEWLASLKGPKGDKGEPGTSPQPKPPDPPVPSVTAAWAVVIENTAARTPEIARCLSDTAGWNQLGIKWHHYDAGEPYASTPQATAAVAAAGGLPALLLLDDKGKVIRSVKLPATVADVKAEVLK